MKKYINYIVIAFICFFSFIDAKAQYKIEEDEWGGQYSGRLISIGFHTCGTFFDKVPLSLSTQYQSKNEFSNELEKIYSSIQRRLHPEWFRDEVREGF